MSIDIKFDLMGNPEPPSIVLANRNGNRLGQLKVNVDSIDVKDKFGDIDEFSFTLNKYIDGEPTPLWDKVVDFKLVNCPEWDLWFEITVELDEATETVKTVYCTQLGQSELSQIMIYNTEINTEADIEREDYKTSILYDEKNPESSILHRLLEKAPHYSIAYVDESIQRIQRQFSFDGVSICEAFNEIAEEIGCLFVYNSNSQAGGKPNRTISVYDLQQNCNNKDCKYRGEFTDKCPKCGSTDITYGYGEDTTIFVTADELATEGIQLVTDTDSVKNCFKLEAGDDLMTATIRNCNPNGSDYIWYFSDSMKEDMSKELVDRIEDYDELYKEHYNSHISQLNGTLVNQYNNLVAKYDDYYNTKSTCLDCKNEGDFEEQCPKCNSKNILTGQKLQTIPTTITGYPALMTAYYNTIDLLLYLESGLMPNVKMSDTTAEAQVGLLTTPSLSPVAVNVKDIKNASEATANSAVLSMAKVLIRPTYKVDIVDGSSSLSKVDANGEYKTWTGKFVVTNYSDDKDTATSGIISVRINNATETFIEQKIDKALNKENTDDYSIAGLFSKNYEDFCKELKKYALNPLDSFGKACDTCISILTEQGAGDEDGKPDLYAKLYKPYFDKQRAINDEIKVRESEIAIIEGVWDKSEENNPKCIIKGLQQYIEDCQKEIQDALNFEGYLGEDLWLEFCSYRREDKYSNSNYISDGLDNAELFKKANEFIEVAQEEIFKSAELQHSISANLNNLLALPKFKPLLKSFKTGNWIRVRIDDKVYKLRLLEYNFGYGDSKNISVEFSDVTKIKNGITDVQDVFEQASSMASSYDSVQRQAEKGNVARSTIDQWIVDGLNSANVQIRNNDSEEVILTQTGLLARSYDDITGTYSPEQFKLTHNIMAYTDDNWETVSSALGKHNYKYWKDNNFVDAEGYGLTSKFVSAGYITGSQIISGEIVSSNYKPKELGTYFNLNNGDFEIAGGKITYDASGNAVTLKGVTIQWDSLTEKPTVNDISDLGGYLDQLEDLEDQLDGRIQTYSQSDDPSISWTDEEKANHIGDLWLNPNTGLTKRWSGNGWLIVTDSDLKELAQSKAQIFTSTPTPPYYVGDLWVQGASGDIMHCINKRESGTYAADDWSKSSKYTNDDALNNFISGDYANTLIGINQSIKNSKARSWYQAEDPSKSWDVTENHIGDLWYCCDENQKTYIYTTDGWQETNVPKVVFDTIDGKRQIFVLKPTSAYRTGDLWIIGDEDCDSENDTIKINKVEYSAGTTMVAKLPSGIIERESYVEEDWFDISTHDGILALNNSVQALGLLSDIASDEKITSVEKQQIKLLVDNITSDKNSVIIQCNAYDVDYSDYLSKYNALLTCVNSILSDMNNTTDVPTTYSTAFSEYYSAKENIVSDIETATKGYSDSLYAVLEGQMQEIVDDLEQVDGRIQTFYQDNDPSMNWEDDKKSIHEGDVWVDTDNGATYQWEKDETTNLYKWVEIQNEYLTSLAQSKAQIFTEKPDKYSEGDLIIPSSNFTVSDVTYYARAVYTAIASSTTFNNLHWTGLDYTNDDALNSFIENDYKNTLESLHNSIDGKADTYYQEIKPHEEYSNIDDTNTYNLWVGDLWYDTTSGKTYMYQKTAIDNNKYKYEWKFMDVPDSVFDAIDSVASIYTTIPKNPIVGDLLIPTSDLSGGYKANKVYKWTGEEWDEIKYTDDTLAQQALEEARQGIKDAGEAFSLAETAQKRAEDAETNSKSYTDDKATELKTAYESYTNSEVGKLDEKVSDYLGWDGTTIINDKYVISPYLGGGYLNITGINVYKDNRVIIDPSYLSNTDYIFQVQNANGIAVGIKDTGDAVFRGNITATSLTLDGASIPYEKIDNKPTKLSEFENDLDVATTDYVKVESTTDETTGITTTTTTVGDKSYTTYTSEGADYLLTNIGMGSETPLEDDISNAGYTNGYFKVSKEGLLIANNAIIWGTIYATDGKFSGDIEADSLTLREDIKLGNDTDGYHTWISKDGILSTENANISGTINAAAIKGSTIEGGSLFIGDSDSGYYAWISEDGVLNADGANITGIINASAGGTIAGWKINENELSDYEEDTEIAVGLSAGYGGTYNTDQNLGLVLYAGIKATNEIRDIAGTWRFNEDFVQFMQNASFEDFSVSFSFYGWFKHPTYGWTKYDGENAELEFNSSSSTISLSVDNGKQILWKCNEDEITDEIGTYLLNREIGFGSVGIDDFVTGDYEFHKDILQKVADFISGSIGLYPAMLDKNGRLYVNDVRLNNSSMINTDACTVKNIVMANNTIECGKGWMQVDGFYLGENGLSVGEKFFVLRNSGELMAGSIKVDDEVTCRKFYAENTSTKNGTNYKTSVELLANGEPTNSDANVTGGLYWKTNGVRTGLTYYADANLITLVGNWKDAGGSTTVTSDARLKHDIETLDARYDMFFDNLLSQRFKYNIGTSDRYHIGYTTQGVQAALKIAEIPEQEFAGVVTYNQGAENEESALRYYEFVALNTDQIQKLKRRVTELENRLKSLE